MRATKAPASLRICAVSPESSLLANTICKKSSCAVHVDVLPHNLISLVPPWRQSCPDRVVSNKIPRKPGKRKLSSTATASWEHLLLYLQINRAKNMGHLITADERRIQFDKLV